MRLIMLLITAFAIALPVAPASAAPLGSPLSAAAVSDGAGIVTVQSRRGGGGGRRMLRAGRGGGARFSGGRQFRGSRAAAARPYRASPRAGGARRVTRATPRVRAGARADRRAAVRRSDVRQSRRIVRRGDVRQDRRAVRRADVRQDRRAVRRADVRRDGRAARRAAAGVGRRDWVARPGRVENRRNARYWRAGRWYDGYPRWRGGRRWHNGYYWRPAYDGWYYWYDDAWLSAPAFGVIVGASVPLWAGAYDTTVVVTYAAWTPEWYDWCATRYRSFDPSTGFWLSYSGVRRFCVYGG
jgi:hypothetical protein